MHWHQTCAEPSEQCKLPGRCVEGECVYDDAPDGTACDDGDEATYFDTCEATMCAGVEPVVTPDKEFTFTGLEPFTTYAFQVAARTFQGQGPVSEAERAKTLAGTPSGPPQDVVGSARSSTSLRVTWREPLYGERRGVITKYTLRVQQLDDGRQPTEDEPLVLDTPDAGRSFNVTGLELYTFYKVRACVRACVCVFLCVEGGLVQERGDGEAW